MSALRCFLVSGFGCVDGVTPTGTPAAGAAGGGDGGGGGDLNTKRVLHT